MMRHHRVAIAGMGLSALTTAARLTELGVKDIALYADGSGGTPFIAAINFVLPDNPYGDTPERYEEDMLQAGYDLGDWALVHEMASRTLDGYQLLRRWGVNFAVNDDGSTKLRHVSGHSCPRSLCRTDILIGREILREMIPRLEKAGVGFHRGCEVVELDFNDGRRVVFDCQPLINQYKLFAPLRDKDVFARFALDGWTVTWLDGTVDIAPEHLYELGKAA